MLGRVRLVCSLCRAILTDGEHEVLVLCPECMRKQLRRQTREPYTGPERRKNPPRLGPWKVRGERRRKSR